MGEVMELKYTAPVGMVRLGWMTVSVNISTDVTDEQAEAALPIIQAALYAGASYAQALLKNEKRQEQRAKINALKGLKFEVEV